MAIFALICRAIVQGAVIGQPVTTSAGIYSSTTEVRVWSCRFLRESQILSGPRLRGMCF